MTGVGLLIAALVIFASTVRSNASDTASPGVSAEIKIGQTLPLSGTGLRASFSVLEMRIQRKSDMYPRRRTASSI